MKLKSFALIGACALLAVSCGSKGGDAKADKDLAAKADSLATYTGQLAAVQRGFTVQNDTTLSSKEAQAEFDNGFMAAFKAVKGGNDAYNAGFSLGLQFAMQVEAQNQQFGLGLDPGKVAQAYKDAAAKNKEMNESAATDVQQKYMTTLENTIATKANAKKAEEAAKSKFQKGAKDIYYKAEKKGQGENAKLGQNVGVRLKLTDMKGTELMPGSGDHVNPVQVGQSPFPMLDNALTQMNEGSTWQVLVTGYDIFGIRTPQNIDPMGTYLMSIELLPAPAQELPAEMNGEPTSVEVNK